MVLLANIINGIAVVLDLVLTFLLIVVVIHAILSWVSPDPRNPIVMFLRQTAEPVLRPIRKFIPPIGGTVDLSPLILIILIYFLKAAIVPTLQYYHQMMLAGVPLS